MNCSVQRHSSKDFYGTVFEEKENKKKTTKKSTDLRRNENQPIYGARIGGKNMEKNRKQAKNMLATTVLILNECLLAGKFLILFGIIIITYFSTLFQKA